MKIYTRTGDGGETGLFGGRRVDKDSPRVVAYGEVDELNSLLGWAASQIPHPAIADKIPEIQRDLFDLGADLATPADGLKSAKTDRVDDDRVAQLEVWIDRFAAELPPQTQFILPGGRPGAGALQVCRAVCRRAERAVVAAARTEELNPQALVYLNRLSDLLFVLARWANRKEGVEEPVWEGGG